MERHSSRRPQRREEAASGSGWTSWADINGRGRGRQPAGPRLLHRDRHRRRPRRGHGQERRLGVDAAGRAVVLLGPPGRAGVAATLRQRRDDGLVRAFHSVQPVAAAAAATQAPVGVSAGAGRRAPGARTRSSCSGYDSPAPGYGSHPPASPWREESSCRTTARAGPTSPAHRDAASSSDTSPRRRAGSGLAERAAGRGALEAAGRRAGPTAPATSSSRTATSTPPACRAWPA